MTWAYPLATQNCRHLIHNPARRAHHQVFRHLRQPRRLFTEQGWPTIDVTRRSIEETAAEILQLMQQRERETAQ